MRTNLKVPFAEKDEAKRLGARWDPANKVWYVKDVADLSAFARWSPSSTDSQPGSSAPKPAATRAKPATTAAMVKVGSRFFELACDCLPWEGCPKCQQAVEEKGWRAA